MASNPGRHLSPMDTSPPQRTQSGSECALEVLQHIFGNQIPDDDFVNYIRIVEDDMKACTFLKLAQTTSPAIVQKWLAKEVLARGTPF
ncbi:hypothetical protein PGT21_005969 [Puccinia graminis f. sp. tritici]|uniref:Uncharacterized protein n=1 Tax=Puccinia graminis f. sp. tritici TaxID=56615 RepID=A0A5B0R4N9_PUCGR|nr:hypothetical protein PGT21_005969 [Puccinia graminis f. sp. tritici]KAA1120440.1 hypothetical protein PGTUg99_019034 [Puccinia graminis f. sp. tritici]